MISLNEKLTSVKDMLKNAIAPAQVFHYMRPKGHKPPYLVWAESGENSDFSVDNGKDVQVIGFTADFYTLTEFDTKVDAIQSCLNSTGLPWSLIAVDYEDETNLIHYTWEFEYG